MSWMCERCETINMDRLKKCVICRYEKTNETVELRRKLEAANKEIKDLKNENKKFKKNSADLKKAIEEMNQREDILKKLVNRYKKILIIFQSILIGILIFGISILLFSVANNMNTTTSMLSESQVGWEKSEEESACFSFMIVEGKKYNYVL